MNKIKFLTLLLIVSLTSCNEDFLNVKPLDTYSDAAVFEDITLTEAYVYNIYMNQQYGFGLEMLASVSDISMTKRSEVDPIVNSQLSDSYLSVFSPGHWLTNYENVTWNQLYKYIRKCNMYFERIEESSLEGEEVDQLSGEVYFLRAYYYHWLLNFWGGVPLVEKTYNPDDNFELSRNTLEETVNFIVQDLNKAISLLPVNGDKARATKGAAMALKSRVWLFAASDLFNSEGDWASSYTNPELISYIGGDRTARWDSARAAAKACIDLGVYSLYGGTGAKTPEEASENYANLFLNNGNEEDILLTFYDIVSKTNAWVGEPGKFCGPNGWHGWGNHTPTQELVDAFEMIDGTAFDWNDPVQQVAPYENRDPRFYANILYNGAPWRTRPDDVIAQDSLGVLKTYYVQEEDGGSYKGSLDTRQGIDDWNGSYTGYYMRKFIDPEIDAQYEIQRYPWRQLRYAEVLLNYAEACIELGLEDEAKTYLNMIRNRAGMPNIPDSETGDALKERYRNEREVELCYEQLRYFDIRRWMIAPEAYKNAQGIYITYDYGMDVDTDTPNYEVIDVQTREWMDKAYFLPILLDELNRNDALIQNPGY